MKKILLGTIITASLLLSANFAACAGCHGTKGEKKALGKSAIIASFSEAKIISSLKGYKDGSYGGAMKGVMKGQVIRLSDADIANLAKQIVSFK